jgi:L-amino acid N-acyltransferase YncA
MQAADTEREESAHEDASGIRPSELEPPLLSSGVRQAGPSDAHDIAWVQTRSWQFAFDQRLVPRGRPPHDFYAEVRRWGRRIVDGLLPVFVSLREGQLVGYAALAEDAGALTRSAVVQSAHALPELWHDRAAENLVIAASDWLAQRRFRSLGICVLSENSAAQWFLTQQGFQLQGSIFRKGHMHNRYALAL